MAAAQQLPAADTLCPMPGNGRAGGVGGVCEINQRSINQAATGCTETDNRHARECHIHRSIRTHGGTEGQFGGPPPGQPVPSLLDEKELLDEKGFLQQMGAGPT